jgi:hypothetical protein
MYMRTIEQHDGSEQNKTDVSAFEDVINAASHGTLVVMGGPEEPGKPETRAWCINEWALTAKYHSSDGLIMPLSLEERVKLVGSLDINLAQCYFQADKDMILEKVKDMHGSADNFNSWLKLVLMLQPLSYKADMQRLLERCRGRQWDWVPVTRWLEEGAQAERPSRVLCLLAGAGEGKSTLSAALCEQYSVPQAVNSSPAAISTPGDGGSSNYGKQASPPAAADQSVSAAGSLGYGDGINVVLLHHFIKFSDQRRLEPLNVVRSLAFQLAERQVPYLPGTKLRGVISQK